MTKLAEKEELVFTPQMAKNLGRSCRIFTMIQDVESTMKKFDGDGSKKVVELRMFAAHFVLFATEVNNRTKEARKYFSNNYLKGLKRESVKDTLIKMIAEGGEKRAIANNFINVSETLTPVVDKMYNKFIRLLVGVR